MTGSRRLSQAISEGDGISLIVPVAGAEQARSAEEQGAEAVLVFSGNERQLPEIRAATSLPILFYWDGEQADEVAPADACIVEARGDRDTEWLEYVNLNLADRFELAFRIEDEEHMASALEHFDPEIFLLAPQEARDADDPLENVLDLLPDIPAGKLAIADLEITTPDEIAELERAGVDAVIVGSQNIARLVRAAPPEV
jgi:indole-3-glycerol phosphate synthase